MSHNHLNHVSLKMCRKNISYFIVQMNGNIHSIYFLKRDNNANQKNIRNGVNLGSLK